MAIDYLMLSGLVENLHANLCHMSRLVEPCEDNTQLIDLMNHMDTLVQCMEHELNASDIQEF